MEIQAIEMEIWQLERELNEARKHLADVSEQLHDLKERRRELAAANSLKRFGPTDTAPPPKISRAASIRQAVTEILARSQRPIKTLALYNELVRQGISFPDTRPLSYLSSVLGRSPHFDHRTKGWYFDWRSRLGRSETLDDLTDEGLVIEVTFGRDEQERTTPEYDDYVIDD